MLGNAPIKNVRRIAVQALIGIGIFSTVVALATLVYCLEGWGFGNALSMAIITIFGVGYGEVEPVDTTVERITTMLTIIAGSVATVCILGAIVQIITEKEFQKARADHRELKTILLAGKRIVSLARKSA